MSASSGNPIDLWWLGQSGFLVHWNGRFLLLDPYLSDSLTRKYAQTDKPHVRMSQRVIAPERLDFIDVVTSSHDHTDHLDPETLRPLAEVNPNLTLICPEAVRATARERSGLPNDRILGLDFRDDGQRVAGNVGSDAMVAGFRLHAVPAAHETVTTDPQGYHLYLGYVVQAGRWTIYHSGDSVRWPGMADRLKAFAIDMALLPINGRAPERRVAGNFWGHEAARLAKDIGARLVVPCHYDMFAFNTATPDEFTNECRRLSQPFRVLRQGERLRLDSSS